MRYKIGCLFIVVVVVVVDVTESVSVVSLLSTKLQKKKKKAIWREIYNNNHNNNNNWNRNKERWWKKKKRNGSQRIFPFFLQLTEFYFPKMLFHLQSVFLLYSYSLSYTVRAYTFVMPCFQHSVHFGRIFASSKYNSVHMHKAYSVFVYNTKTQTEERIA